MHGRAGVVVAHLQRELVLSRRSRRRGELQLHRRAEVTSGNDDILRRNGRLHGARRRHAGKDAGENEHGGCENELACPGTEQSSRVLAALRNVPVPVHGPEHDQAQQQGRFRDHYLAVRRREQAVPRVDLFERAPHTGAGQHNDEIEGQR